MLLLMTMILMMVVVAILTMTVVVVSSWDLYWTSCWSLFWLMLRVVVVVLLVIMMMMVGLVPVLSGQRPSQLFVLQPDCLAALPCPPESWSDPRQILAPLHRSWSETTDLPAH